MPRALGSDLLFRGVFLFDFVILEYSVRYPVHYGVLVISASHLIKGRHGKRTNTLFNSHG